MAGSLGSQGIFLFCVCPAPVCARKHHRLEPSSRHCPLSDSESAAGGDRAGGGNGGGVSLQKAGQAGGSSQLPAAGEDEHQPGGRGECGRARARGWRTPREVKKRADGGDEQRWRGLEGPPWPAGGRAWSLREAERAQLMYTVTCKQRNQNQLGKMSASENVKKSTRRRL